MTKVWASDWTALVFDDATSLNTENEDGGHDPLDWKVTWGLWVQAQMDKSGYGVITTKDRNNIL